MYVFAGGLSFSPHGFLHRLLKGPPSTATPMVGDPLHTTSFTPSSKVLNPTSDIPLVTQVSASQCGRGLPRGYQQPEASSWRQAAVGYLTIKKLAEALGGLMLAEFH